MIFLGQILPKVILIWVNYLSEKIFLGPARTVDTILIFLGIKYKNTDIYGFSQDFHN